MFLTIKDSQLMSKCIVAAGTVFQFRYLHTAALHFCGWTSAYIGQISACTSCTKIIRSQIEQWCILVSAMVL